jgi:translocator assembly and maintenance protein 41
LTITRDGIERTKAAIEMYHHLHNQHYSGLGYWLGPRYLKWVEHNLFPVNFSPFIEFETVKIKYGITHTRTLLHDLEHWDWLSLAGRMQKPIEVIENNRNCSELGSEL